MPWQCCGFRLTPELVQAYDATGGQRADLDEVTQMVGQPQAAAASLARRRLSASGQRGVDVTTIADLAHHTGLGRPRAQLAPAAAVPHAVRGDLMGRPGQAL